MMIVPFIVVAAAAGLVVYVALKTKKVPIPKSQWKRFDHPASIPLDAETCKNLEGIYTTTEGFDFFGNTAILKSSYTVEGNQTIYHLSIFCREDGACIICEGKKSGNDILLKGYWRNLEESETGTVHLIISNYDRKNLEKLQLQGNFGKKNNSPSEPVVFTYKHLLPKKPSLQIIAHRGGARNIDFIPVSENSLEIFKMAARYGATGVEIDVRFTKDDVPVLFHDSFLSIHTVKKSLYAGLVKNYTLDELKKVELRKGGFTPTLEEALHTIIYQTPLETIWLDIKDETNMEKIHHLQKEYLQKAAAAGRNVKIYLGLSNEKLVESFKQLNDYRNIPSLTELEPEDVLKINAQAWAPQYTGGTQKEEIAKMHAAGKKAFVWTLDDPTMMDLYLTEGGFDGVVTNVPPVVFYFYYSLEEKISAQASSPLR